MPHPRRSQQCRSPRPRARCHHDRSHHSRRIYVAEGRTLLLLQTRAILDLDREERVEWAAADVAMAESAVAAITRDLEWYCEPLSMETRVRSKGVARIQEWLTENKAALADALWELKQAKRSASRPAAVRVSLEVTRLPPPRTWPNAYPGGTSPRRAALMRRRTNFAHFLARVAVECVR